MPSVSSGSNSGTNPSGPSKGLPNLLIRNPNFVLIWLAYGISALGDHLSEVAILKSMGAEDSANTTRMMARISICFMAPFFFFGPLAGWVSDRLPRKWIMFSADMVRCVIMLSFAAIMGYTMTLGSWGPFLPLVFIGVFAAFFSPARNSLLPTLIRETQLVRANALISGLGIIGTMIGFVVGAELANRYTPTVCFRVDAVTYLISGLFVLMIVMRRSRAHGAKREAIGIGELLSGYSYVLRHRRVAQIISFAVVFWAAGATVRSILPAIVIHVYGGTYATIGRYQAAIGLGFVLGALFLMTVGNALRGGLAITWSLIGGGVAAALLSATVLIPFEQSTAAALGFGACVILGIFGTGVMTSCNALLQRIVPNAYRGRVFGVSDQVTIAGLLLATGMLGVPEWPGIDRWVGHILVAVAVLLTGVGVLSLVIRLSQSPFGIITGFVWNANEFYSRWWFRLQRKGPCRVPVEGPVIVAANHTASIDPLLLVASCPYRVIGFMTAREYYNFPLAHILMKHTDCIPVSRDGHDLRSTRTALAHLKKGKVLGIFPEGRIVAPGEEIEAKDGVALLALRSKAVIVPAHIGGTRWSGGVLKSFFSRHRAEVRFGHPIEPGDFPSGSDGRKAATELTQMIMTRIRALAPADKSE